jgi:hypothetical protein
MAVHFSTIPATFIHVPKTGGTSFYHWLNENSIDYKKLYELNRFADVSMAAAKSTWGELGTVFSFTRNPFSRLVSMYFYHYRVAQESLKRSDKPSITALKTVAVSSKGFDYWLECMYFRKKELFSIGDSNPEQMTVKSWFTGTMPDLIIKMENFDQDFVQIQDLFNCYAPLPHVNTTEHLPYREYYNPTTRRWVEEMFAEDLEAFDYEF